MSEKRFELLLPNAVVNDTIVRKSYYLSEKEDVEKVVDLLNHFWDRILYEIKRSGDLHKTIDDLHIFLEDKGLVEEFMEWSKNKGKGD